MNTQKESTQEVWKANPAGSTHALEYVPGTEEFFQKVLKNRFHGECLWLHDLVDFKQFRNKKVLEIGCGAGYDAYQFCINGADYTGIDLVENNTVIAQKHLSYYGLQAQFYYMDAEYLSLNTTFDFVYSFGVLHHIPNIKTVLHNVHRILANDGSVLFVVYYKYSIFYCLHIIIADWLFKGKFLKCSLAERLSEIEFTTSDKKPYVTVYSKRKMHTLLKRCGFEIIKTDIRKLCKEDLPDFPLIRRLYKHIPQSWLDCVAKKFGWYLCVRAKKKECT